MLGARIQFPGNILVVLVYIINGVLPIEKGELVQARYTNKFTNVSRAGKGSYVESLVAVLVYCGVTVDSVFRSPYHSITNLTQFGKSIVVSLLRRTVWDLKCHLMNP